MSLQVLSTSCIQSSRKSRASPTLYLFNHNRAVRQVIAHIVRIISYKSHIVDKPTSSISIPGITSKSDPGAPILWWKSYRQLFSERLYQINSLPDLFKESPQMSTRNTQLRNGFLSIGQIKKRFKEFDIHASTNSWKNLKWCLKTVPDTAP